MTKDSNVETEVVDEVEECFAQLLKMKNIFDVDYILREVKSTDILSKALAKYFAASVEKSALSSRDIGSIARILVLHNADSRNRKVLPPVIDQVSTVRRFLDIV